MAPTREAGLYDTNVVDVNESDTPMAWTATNEQMDFWGGRGGPVLSVPVHDRVVILRFTSSEARRAFVNACSDVCDLAETAKP